MNNQLWYFLIDGQSDEKTGLFGNFYSYGQHLGDALMNTFNDAKSKCFNNPNLIEVSKLDRFEVIENRDELVRLSENVFMRQATHSFPFDDPEKDFVPPIGIAFAVENGEYDYELIKETFVAYEQDENGIFELELVIGKENLKDVFFKTLNFLPQVDGFWIYIQNHWDNDSEEIWIAKHFIEKERVLDFLTSQESNTIDNGYIKIVINCSLGETNLTLDDHKKIQLHTKDQDVFNDFIVQVINLGYKQSREFYNIEWGFHHWHYRPAGSLTRNEFIEMLQYNQFELIGKLND